MSLFADKRWMAQELYNEYLQLKVEISDALHSGIPQKDMCDKIEHLKNILNQLKVEYGIAMEDLILLSIGIDV